MRPERLFDRLTAGARERKRAERAAGFELAVSARRFSRRTQAVVDDKLSFSAALMRAGEVEAANRLLAEVSEEVLTEEVALIERVNEVKVARSIERDKVTRGRLARTLAVAMLGSSLLAFSAAGAAVVGLFKDNDQAVHGSDPNQAGTTKIALEDRVLGTRQVRILDNVSLPMTDAQFRRYTKITKGDIDEKELQVFLLKLLPPALAEKVHFALMTGLDALPPPAADELVVAVRQMNSWHRDSEAASDESDGPSSDQTAEPAEAEPTPDPSGSPDPDPAATPDPEESPEDEDGLPLFHDDDEGH
ncbi:MAG: hypothetical protein QOG04_495 [Actinomycetota bacterium]|jgi:hypothetical protein|nr:hypothetical protein [Actinomycetota bacterium]